MSRKLKQEERKQRIAELELELEEALEKGDKDRQQGLKAELAELELEELAE